ncbi:MAG TPA: FAD-binding oxidoreductase [Nocardioides sp.]|uniref:FAD-binding oxidoreductase n=1 Tax=Nocardioides sp. TaxID=35761 RepID=UPI002E349133|nr:FAD-binding oxidoreductase [Nocardioides sp.]HEX3932328.1 FAD-binding oxidoreductase [Nocardioides sp.]
MDALLAALTEIVGPTGVVTEHGDVARYVTDWTGAFTGSTAAVVRPASTAEVAAVLATCRSEGVALVPQGGNTGLVGGGIPYDGEVLLSLERMAGPPEVDALAGQAVVAAGTPIETVQRAAREAGWEYGVDLASRGSATVGGTVATNAGGLRVLRYGDTRAQLVGVEAVLGDGRTVAHMRGLTRDNAGYHLPSLLAGSEGTLGVVTAARLRLVPPQRTRATALLGFDSLERAIEAAQLVRRASGDVEAVELMTEAGMGLVARVKGLAAPFALPAACLLVEVAGRSATDDLVEIAEGIPGVTETALAEGGAARERLWAWRESHTESINTLGPPLKLDVTLPGPALAEFIGRVPQVLAAVATGARPWFFGHVADGNVHVNVSGVESVRDRASEAVLREVASYGGSISSEHGIGRAKRRWLELSRSAEEIETMRVVKRALDPDGILNPGVLCG